MTQGKKTAKSLILSLALIVCVGVFTVSGYFLYQELAVYRKGKNEYSQWAEQVISVPQSGEDANSPLRRVVDFNKLRQTNPEVVGWIYLPDTVVDYPVVQGDDNDKYLDTLFSGEKNKAGSIFMDYRNQPDFSDDNTILYGHNMKNDTMFHILVEYAEQEFYDQHKTLYYYTEDGVYELKVFSVFRAHATDDYTAIDYGNAKDARQKDLAAKSTVKTEHQPTPEQNIVTFSTCTYEFDDARFVVQATVNKMPYGGVK